MKQSTIVFLIFLPLVLWRIYSRIKRLMVRQQSHLWRHWVAAIMMPAILVGFAVAAITYPLSEGGLACGTLAGAALAWLALRKTQFERVGDDFFFTPNARIGLAVSLIFIGRMLYRAFEVYSLGGGQPEAMGKSPLTLLALGLMAGYYTVYAGGLLRWRRSAGAH
ncbi:MAG: hypothetical protein V4463_23970 [Pseudomonadota bacterium]